MINPLISVLVPSYNHGKFISQTIASILNQTHNNFEIVIVDDGSSDDSIERILEFRDTRIRLIQLNENVGACKAMNIGIQHCQGKFIAVCNSDDLWANNKLEAQLAVFRRSPELAAVFSDVEWINGAGELIASPFSGIFSQPNRSRYKWLSDLITTGNCLCHPSVMIRKKVYDKVGLYNNYYRQLPDYDMWLRVLQHYNIFVSQDKLVRFRLHENNTSKPSTNVSTRDKNEMRLILSSFFRNITSDNFFGAFGYNKNRITPETLHSEIAAFLLSAGGFRREFMNQLGQQMIMELEPQHRNKVGVSALEFQKYTASIADFEQIQTQNTQSTTNFSLSATDGVIFKTRTIDLLKVIFERIQRKAGLRK